MTNGTPPSRRTAGTWRSSRIVSGKLEIYVRPFPDVNSRQWPVSTAGGSEAVWAPNGTELFYVAADGKLMAVPVEVGRDLAFGKPAVLFDADAVLLRRPGRNYDVAPDGKRFIMVKSPATEVGGAMPLTVVLHWVDELRSRVK